MLNSLNTLVSTPSCHVRFYTHCHVTCKPRAYPKEFGLAVAQWFKKYDVEDVDCLPNSKADNGEAGDNRKAGGNDTVDNKDIEDWVGEEELVALQDDEVSLLVSVCNVPTK